MAELQAPHPRALEAVRIRSASLPEDRAGMLAVLETANMHRVPSSEMHDLDVGEWYVAERVGRIVGVAGYRLERREGELVGKTTLLAVLPSERTHGVGRSLQERRMSRMRRAGASKVVTNADRPETIEWYKRHFGYREIGSVAKTCEFGLPGVDHWTTLEAPLS
jgi:3-keto-5-aminohexanoate cleavage enzyme